MPGDYGHVLISLGGWERYDEAAKYLNTTIVEWGIGSIWRGEIDVHMGSQHIVRMCSLRKEPTLYNTSQHCVLQSQDGICIMLTVGLPRRVFSAEVYTNKREGISATGCC